MSSAHLQQLQAQYARRREIEHQRTQRTEALNRYYDDWNKYTTRYQNWTAPQYYESANEKLNKRAEEKRKEQTLEKRREMLRSLLANENQTYEQEQRMKWRPRSQQISKISNEMLEKIDEKAKEEEQLRRKLELESKMYGRLRHGVDDEKLLYENSKSDNEVLAKLNWLDKQVENQLEREKEQKYAQEQQLRIQEEMARIEQSRKEREKLREQEIKEIRALQEEHMRYLTERQQECERLKEQELAIRTALEEIDKESELLEESIKLATAPTTDLSTANNGKKIKQFIKQRSQVVVQHIQLFIEMLERLSDYALKRADVNATLCKYKEQLELEVEMVAQIDAMYESEAISKLARYEELWKMQQLQRCDSMRDILKNEQNAFSALLGDNLQRQNETLEVRATHLSSIENSNDKLNQLMKEDQQSEIGAEEKFDAEPKITLTTNDTLDSSRDNCNVLPKETALPSSSAGKSFNRTKQSYRGETQPELQPKLMSSFNNLNLDCWENIASARVGPVKNTEPQASKLATETVERPKFGRKRIAWT